MTYVNTIKDKKKLVQNILLYINFFDKIEFL